VVPWRAPKNVVLQHNALAEARYRLSVRAQKLLIRLLDELDQRGDNFCDIKLFLKDFSGLLSADPSCQVAGRGQRGVFRYTDRSGMQDLGNLYGAAVPTASSPDAVTDGRNGWFC
jgi:Initiator Replication protein